MTLQDAGQSITIVLLIMAAARVVGFRGREDYPGPARTGSIILFALVAIPTVAQAFYHPLLTALQRTPHEITAHHQYWRLFTSELVQDGGVSGAVFNLVTLAIVGTFAGWFWGGTRTIAIFFGLGMCFDIVNVLEHQAGAGNSGATYGLCATMVGYALLRGPVKWRPLYAASLAAGAVIWALGDIHGYAVLAGGALGAILALASVTPELTDWYHRASRSDAPTPPSGHRSCISS